LYDEEMDGELLPVVVSLLLLLTNSVIELKVEKVLLVVQHKW